MFRRRFLRLVFHAFSLVVGKESFKVVTIGAIATKSVFIEQALDAAAGANLVGTSLGADGPTHLAMPAPPQDHGSTRHPGGQKAHGPEPARALLGIRT
jgi:hypothetical protein